VDPSGGVIDEDDFEVMLTPTQLEVAKQKLAAFAQEN
jgi:hypothetical protein